jgi:hypothetical protein
LTRTLAKLLSAVLHPLLVPSYLVAVLAYGFPPALLPLSGEARWQALLLVWGLTFWLPGLAVWLLVRSGRVSSVELYERRQRPLPLLLAATAFAAATALVAWVPALRAPLLPLVLGGITAAVLLTLLITLWWKISAHGVGLGGAVGLLALLVARPGFYPTDERAAWWLAAAVLAAAAVFWARLRLQAHTPAQLWAGLGLGAALVLGVGVALG